MSWKSIEPSEVDGEIRRRLLSPMRQVSLDELAGMWCVHTIAFRMRGLGRLVGDPVLPGRLRGAFGTALMGGASEAALAGKPCTFDPPSAFEALFRKQGRMTPGLDLASPWLMLVDTARGDLVISLRLFGFAVEWAPAAAEAMTRSLRELMEWPRPEGVVNPAAEILRRTATTTISVEARDFEDGAVLELLSPLVVSGRDPRDEPASLLTGLGTRLSALARWHDVALEDSVDWRAVKKCAGELTYVFAEASNVEWRRTSSRQGRTIPMQGLLGLLSLRGYISREVGTMLQLGETCSMGADVALGCGRYRVAA